MNIPRTRMSFLKGFIMPQSILTLDINGTGYTVVPIAGPDGQSWRIKNRDSENVYDVAVTYLGASCSCPDHQYRHKGKATLGCKHVRALREVDLLGVTRPTSGAFVRSDTARGALGWYVIQEVSPGRFEANSGPHRTRTEARRMNKSESIKRMYLLDVDLPRCPDRSVAIDQYELRKTTASASDGP
jgi:hypothetical protein